MTETNRIELKRELTDELDIEKEVIAFLNNREGGIIYVGFDKDGRVVGVKDIDGDMLKIKDRIRNAPALHLERAAVGHLEHQRRHSLGHRYSGAVGNDKRQLVTLRKAYMLTGDDGCRKKRGKDYPLN